MKRTVLQAIGVVGALLLPSQSIEAMAAEVASHGAHGPGDAEMAAGYEVKDLSAKGLGFALLTLAIVAALLIGIVFGMIALFSSWDRQATASLTRQQTAAIVPPGPHLQIDDPTADLARQRARELRRLNGYAWIDPAHTMAHVPIGRAMALVTSHTLDEAP